MIRRLRTFLAGMSQPRPATVTLTEVRPPALISADGAFFCTPQDAVEVAYMLSTAEAYIMAREPYGEPREDGSQPMQLKHPFARMEVAELIAEFLDGQMSTQEVRAELVDFD